MTNWQELLLSPPKQDADLDPLAYVRQLDSLVETIRLMDEYNRLYRKGQKPLF